MSIGVLTFLCGKMGAGKSTKARDIAGSRNAVLLSEDEWLASLFPNCINSLEEYIEYSNRLQPQMKALVQSVLSAGTDVVMDFPANTVAQREWFRSIFSKINAPHELIYIEQADEVCIEQIAKRRADQPQRAATDTKEMFELMRKHFEPPSSNEGFNIVGIK